MVGKDPESLGCQGTMIAVTLHDSWRRGFASFDSSPALKSA